jgi:uncharacterized lipoprotein YajG
MKTLPRLVPLAVAAVVMVFLPGCEKPQDTLKTLQTEVSAYASNPSDEAAAKIENNFTRLDEQIAKLRQDGKATEADTLAQQKSALQTQYAAARMTASLLKAKEAAAGVGEAFRKAGEAFGEALQGQSGNND